MDRFGIWDEGDVALATEKGYYPIDCRLADHLLARFKPRGILDLGCGPGKYVRHFLAAGVPAVGYDGAPFKGVGVINLATPIDLPKHDLVLSLEVGEHIPKEYESVYLANLVSVTGRILVISWATVGQGGLGHVNEQPNEYVIGAVERAGLRFSGSDTESLRANCYLPYLKRTLLVFRA